MTTLFPDLLRAAVTDIMLVQLLYQMSTPKYKSKYSYIVITLLLVALNLSVNTYFYLRNDYTAVARMDLLMLLVVAVVLKPLFRETTAQWCFIFVTLLNIYVAVVVISYFLCGFFPSPFYAIILLRFALFAAVTLALRRYFLPLYREVLRHWNVYIPMLVGLFINLAYFMFGEDIEQRLTDFMWPMLLLVLLEILIYISIFYSMSSMARENVLAEENLKMQSDRTLLHLAVTSMAERLRLMDEAVHQQCLAAHDSRHFNGMVLELLEQGLAEEATAFLRKQTSVSQPSGRRYCENTAVNAAVSYYAVFAQGKGIATDISIEIPSELAVDALELAMALSNLLENAIHGCEVLPEKAEKHLRFTCRHVGRLILEISNPCTKDTALCENGYPIALEDAHGLGTKSVLAFAKKVDAEVFYRVENGTFTVRMLV